MTLVFAPDKPPLGADRHMVGDMVVLVGTVTFSGSYATGGDALDLTQYYKGQAAGRSIIPISPDVRGNGIEYDLTNKKLKLFSSANTELAAGAYNAALTATPVPIAFLVK
jgi:hypothetical protein